MHEDVMDRTVRELRSEVNIDFIDVSFIAESLREDLNLQSQHDIRCLTLNVIQRLMEQGVYPGDYDRPAALSFWPGQPSEHLRRIEAEWKAMGHTPTLENPICWFGLKGGNTA